MTEINHSETEVEEIEPLIDEKAVTEINRARIEDPDDLLDLKTQRIQKKNKMKITSFFGLV